MDNELPEVNIGSNEDSKMDKVENVEPQEDIDEKDNGGIRQNPEAKQLLGKIVKFQSNENHEQVTAKVVSRAGKATGLNRDWYNLEYVLPENLKGEKLSVDLSKVKDMEIQEVNISSEIQESVFMIQEQQFEQAKQKELLNWKNNKVYSKISGGGYKTISTRWVCTLKETPDGLVPKARLVVRGFEEPEKEQLEKDSPTCSMESLKLILAIMVQNGWKPCSMDIKTAFLQGYPLSRDIYIKPPKEAHQDESVWKLNKCVYGLTDASLYWYTKVRKVLVDLEAKISKLDPAVFYWCDNGSVQGILACHVDDFIWAGTHDFANNVMAEIRNTFHVGKEDTKAFKYVGLEISQVGENITLEQQDYAKGLSAIDVDKHRSLQKDMPLDEREKEQLRSKIGQGLWIARQSRPDIMFDVCQLASNYSRATVQDLLDVNKVLKRIALDRLTLKFQPLKGEVSLVIFTDASFGNLPDGGTQGGYLVLLVGEGGKFSPICWNSKRVRRVVRSTLAGETLAMSEGVDVGIYLAAMYTELNCGAPKSENVPLVCITDNRSLCDAVRSNKSVTEKRLRLEISNIKDMLSTGQIKEIKWAESEKQLADCLTKKGASPYHMMSVLEKGQLQLDW